MDIFVIGVIAFAVVFIVGGLVAGHYASKASQNEAETNKDQKIK